MRCKTKKKYWSAHITKHSIALDLEERVFTWNNPENIALSLKRSAEASVRRKARTPYQSAPGNFFMYLTDKNVSLTNEHEVCGDVDPTLEGVYKNEQGTLCVKQKSTNYHQVDITITNGGQIIFYRNNINDLDKN